MPRRARKHIRNGPCAPSPDPPSVPSPVLREAKNCAFVREGVIRRRYAFVVGSRDAGVLRPGPFARAARAQLDEPVPLIESGARRWWWYRDRFWWDDEGYGPDDVVALVADRERRARRRLERAHAALEREGVAARRTRSAQRLEWTAGRQGHASPARREPLPRDVRLAVWRRDRGRCRECGSGFDLQYDHVIPLALGGASSVDNLQLLCADCNRAKGTSL
jgi:5-methylcytosine-specific restriction endonuclease McrA